MATNASPFIVNIVDLQNIATGISGTSKDSLLAQAQSDIANLQQIVNFENKSISIDTINSYTQGRTIDVMASLNLSNASLYTNSNAVILTTSTVTASNVSLTTIGDSSTQVNVNNLANTISFVTAGTRSFQMNSSGVGYFTSDVYIGGTIYVNGIVNSSDKELKIDFVPFSTSLDRVLQLQPYNFNWKVTGKPDIGFVAQDVQAVWPELTERDPNGSLGIAYSRFIPLLLEGIRDLNENVKRLNRKQSPIEGKVSSLEKDLSKLDEIYERVRNLENIVDDTLFSLEDKMNSLHEFHNRISSLENHLRSQTSNLSNGSIRGNESVRSTPIESYQVPVEPYETTD